ncbi:PSD1 and planctomycete cytochrome C domain-containing protein [Flavihumibacter sp. RY-1]|uniref:PSD1 and planctomycete cytochrome C domain-containing protein n=2 Tax=Flavihumibacter fluminis TaxID=2909236 RepID=A0ABS9BI93_9BACT|nr:PSD1 and planctomycete cytochrome C domain-containing protein [Flavihumibacter fluminis]
MILRRNVFIPVLLFLLVGGLLYSCDNTSMQTASVIPDSVSYNFDVRPILSDKCFSCHGPDANKREAGLRLDIEDSAFKALQDNPSAHAWVPGKPDESDAFLRITTQDTSLLMPPLYSNLSLTSQEIAIIKKWIKQGARYEDHWAFVAPRKQAPPAIKKSAWPINEIDFFTLAAMEAKGFSPNEPADKERLLKRLCLDLTGLPPSVELMDAFLADTRPDAYERMVDQLLALPAYGEKMALHWLDLARYADSHGYQDDGYRTQWPWRDWVIHAFNENKPYNEFVTWQLAGDLLPDASMEQLLATAFNRNHKITEEGGVIPEEYRVMYVSDRTDLLGKGILGVTMECARCHDHKYDPFSQKEYFQLYSFFNNIREEGIESVIGGPETYAKKPMMQITNADVTNMLQFINKTDTGKMIVSVMGELDTIRPTFVLHRGEYDAPGEKVEPATPVSILPFDNSYPKNRLGLAKWLFDPKHPLTSRVYVNLLWQEFFGRGLVKTSGDFGMQGDLPSHPALLDWLAVDFREHNWDIKRLVKLMVTSATYRQSAIVSKEKLAKDPENIYLSRGPRYRIHAEFIRDLVLSSSGLLNPEIGGPSVKPYQPAGLWEGATSGRGLLSIYTQDHGAALYRRGMYTLIKRTVPPPALSIFDASNRDICEVKRLRTNTPLQALVMLNDPTVLEAARVLATKLQQEAGAPEAKIKQAFRRIVCRNPDAKETEVLVNYYQQERTTMDKSTAQKMIRVGESPLPQQADILEIASLMRVITAIYNLEETITKS